MLATLPRLAGQVVLPPWKSAIRPDFMPLAKQAILQVLKPGDAMSTRDLYAAVQRVNAPTPEVLVPEPYAPEVRKIKDRAPAPEPEHPELSIRSMSHLKRRVLPVLASHGIVQKIHRTRVLSEEEIAARVARMTKAQRKASASALENKVIDEWVWITPDPAKAKLRKEANTRERQRVREEAEEAVRPWGWQVGVGQNTDHLSRRRARSREGHVSRAATWVRELEKAKAEQDVKGKEKTGISEAEAERRAARWEAHLAKKNAA